MIRFAAAALLAALAPTLAHAHAQPGVAGGLVDGLLHPERAARLADRQDGGGLTFDGLLRALIASVFGDGFGAGEGDGTDVRRAVQDLLVDRLMDLAANPVASASVRTIAEAALLRIAVAASERARQVPADSLDFAHAESLARRVGVFVGNPAREPRRAPGLSTPDGSPIGAGG